jgi:hypothetical protein
MGLVKPGTTHGFPGMCLGLDCHDAVGLVFGWVYNPSKPFQQSEPLMLAGNRDPLLTLLVLLQYSQIIQYTPEPLSVT